MNSQDAPLDELNNSTKHADALKLEESNLKEFVKNHIYPISEAFDHLTGAAGSITTMFKASDLQPISNLKATVAAALQDSAAAVASALKDVGNCKPVEGEMATEAEEIDVSKAAAATAETKSATAKRKLPPTDAVDGVKSSCARGYNEADAGKVCPLFHSWT